jgi:hypothetical protein
MLCVDGMILYREKVRLINVVFDSTLDDVRNIIMNFVKKEALYKNGTDEFENLYENNFKNEHNLEESETEEVVSMDNKDNKDKESKECKHEKELKENFEKSFIPLIKFDSLSNATTNDTQEIESPDNNSTDILLQISQQLIKINSLN